MFGQRRHVASVAPYKGGATLRYSATPQTAVANATQCYTSATLLQLNNFSGGRKCNAFVARAYFYAARFRSAQNLSRFGTTCLLQVALH